MHTYTKKTDPTLKNQR